MLKKGSCEENNDNYLKAGFIQNPSTASKIVVMYSPEIVVIVYLP